MPAIEAPRKGGFSFDLCRRNASLQAMGYPAPTATKTGTTIAGIVFKGGVVLGADTRATGGDVVADKNCDKIAYVAPNIYSCGAGTAADTVSVASMVSSTLDLHRYATNRQSRVVTAVTLFKRHLSQYQGNIGCALVIGGVDLLGAHIHTIFPHGSTDYLPYATMGSGSLAAMAVFEAGYKDDMTEEEAVELVCAAIKSGIFNDLGSGSNVDLTVITKEGTKVMRSYETPNPRTYSRTKGFAFPPGTSKIISTHVEVLKRGVAVGADGASGSGTSAMEE
eukprot:TRINITY_DN32524_c0_g1_i1.p1 TRINITY_DN32524_c0_g1~~TRINITY_DN32524_c0_g1_i1.p1  ORF type:complete len:279 (+),score=41.89 TRINITY_DN32524_c0_g1_i1:257-1093(+)